MPANIFSKSIRETRIFRHEQYLFPEFVPERLPHRDAEINSLVYAFNPVLKGSKPHNIFAFGPTGVGKTACVKYVLNQLEEFSERAKSLYINCFEYDSRASILSKIAEFLGAGIPRRGISTDETYSKIIEAMKKAAFTPIVILDEIDRLASTEEQSALLYDLLRIIEYQSRRFGIAIISNDIYFTIRLDARVRSSLSAENIEFKPYTPQQLKDILRERAEQAFVPNALDAEVINVAAAHAAKSGGDARIAIEALWKAGREADYENVEKVTLRHLRKAIDKIKPLAASKLQHALTEQEKLLLKIISDNAGITSGELYKKFSRLSQKKLSERRIRELIESFEKRGILKAELLKLKEKGGRTRCFKLAVNFEDLK